MRAPGGSTAIPDLCIVVPALNEEENLPVLHAELARALDARGLTFQLLVVDDGSRDKTPNVIRGIAQRDSRVVGLRLSRNSVGGADFGRDSPRSAERESGV